MKKILKIAVMVIFTIVFGASTYIYMSGPALPKEAEERIESVLTTTLPEMVKGQQGFANSKGLNIWYESISPRNTSKGAILLIMGISNDALGWPPKFIQSLVDSGYQVIRYDHRGTGMSDWVTNWDSQKPYSLADMAKDGIAVLDSLNIQKASVIGISMGGMIAQELAINHPHRVATLTSMMSSGYITDPDLPKISSSIAVQLITTSLKYGIIGGEKNLIRMNIASRVILMGNANYDLDAGEIAQQVLYNLRERNGYNPSASRQHQAAVLLSGSRYDKLKALSIPTLIIHGKSDQFIPIAHGEKCVSVIPNARSLWLDGMGHDIPNELVKILSKTIIANIEH